MGKALIILGADFSSNGFISEVLNPTWTENMGMISAEVSTSRGQTRSSTMFKVSNTIKIPQGVTKLKYTRPIYTTSGGSVTGYGMGFYDNTKTIFAGDDIPIGETGIETVTIPIPNGAEWVRFTYLMSSDTPFYAEVYN